MKKIKSICAAILVGIMIFGMYGCGGGESAEQAVSSMLDAVKVMDAEKASQYIDVDKLMDAGKNNEDQSEEDKAESEKLMKLILQNLSYKISSTEEDGDKAVVKVDITNIDMSEVMTNLLSQAIGLAFSGASSDDMDAKMMGIMESAITDKDAKTVTKTVDVKLEKKDGKWKVDTSDELMDAILGGMISYSEEMNSSFGGDSESSKLSEIDNWLIGDIWNKGFCDILGYISTGKSSTGETMDIDFTIEQLRSAMEKKSEYESFISGLSEDEYSEIKAIWSKLSVEIDALWNKVEAEKPEANSGNEFDTGLFVQYRDAFSDAVYSLD